jgi:hypothetical protein
MTPVPLLIVVMEIPVDLEIGFATEYTAALGKTIATV